MDTVRGVLVRIAEGGADAERLQELTYELRAELLWLDVDEVTLVSGGDSPPGSRAIDLAAVGSLLVSMKDSLQLLGQVAAAVEAWLGRGSAGRTVELSIGDKALRVTSVSSDQQDRLIEEFIHAVARDRPR